MAICISQQFNSKTLDSLKHKCVKVYIYKRRHRDDWRNITKVQTGLLRSKLFLNIALSGIAHVMVWIIVFKSDFGWVKYPTTYCNSAE